MDMMLVAAFLGFFALVFAWMVAPADAKPAVTPIAEPSPIVAAESPV